MFKTMANSYGQLERIFFELDHAMSEWARSKDNVLLFDTKFGTNRAAMKLGLFCTVAFTGQTVILAACLLLHEDEASFKWAFECVAELLRMPPTVFFTDGDVAMARAIADLQSRPWWDVVKHMLCVFHLFKNFYEYLHPLFVSQPEEWKNANSKFWALAKESDSEKKELFEEEFQELFDIVKEAGSGTPETLRKATEFLERLLDKKEQWAYRFCMAHFSAGVHSTARAEGKNSKVSRLVTANTLMVTLLEQLVNDNLSCRSARDASDVRLRLKQMAKEHQLPCVSALQGAITEYAYDLLCAQAAQATQYKSDPDAATQALAPEQRKYYVERRRTQEDEAVTVNEGGTGDSCASSANELQIDSHGRVRDVPFGEEFGLEEERSRQRTTTMLSCSCQFHSCFGLPCRHMLHLYLTLQVDIPMRIVNSKWTSFTAAEVEMRTSALRYTPRPSRQISPTANNGGGMSREDRRAIVHAEARVLMDLCVSAGDEMATWLRASLRNLLAQAQATITRQQNRQRRGRADASTNAAGVYYQPPPVLHAPSLSQSAGRGRRVTPRRGEDQRPPIQAVGGRVVGRGGGVRGGSSRGGGGEGGSTRGGGSVGGGSREGAGDGAQRLPSRTEAPVPAPVQVAQEVSAAHAHLPWAHAVAVQPPVCNMDGARQHWSPQPFPQSRSGVPWGGAHTVQLEAHEDAALRFNIPIAQGVLTDSLAVNGTSNGAGVTASTHPRPSSTEDVRRADRASVGQQLSNEALGSGNPNLTQAAHRLAEAFDSEDFLTYRAATTVEAHYVGRRGVADAARRRCVHLHEVGEVEIQDGSGSETDSPEEEEEDEDDDEDEEEEELANGAEIPNLPRVNTAQKRRHQPAHGGPTSVKYQKKKRKEKGDNAPSRPPTSDKYRKKRKGKGDNPPSRPGKRSSNKGGNNYRRSG